MKSTGSEEMKEVYLDNSATTMAYRKRRGTGAEGHV